MKNTFKFSTFIFLLLGVLVPFWPITLPLFWFLAYRSYASGVDGATEIGAAVAKAIKSSDKPQVRATVERSEAPDIPMKWKILCDVDPDVNAAAERVRSKGAQWEAILAEKYIALGDKTYLDALTKNVIEEADATERKYQDVAALPWEDNYYGYNYKTLPDGRILGQTPHGERMFPTIDKFQDYAYKAKLSQARQD